MQTFRTTFEIKRLADNQIDYKSKLLLVGSCFADNIGSRLTSLRFSTVLNPHGILYNPLSIEKCFDDIVKNRKYGHDDLIYFNEKWLSLNHHGCFSDSSAELCLQNINSSVDNAHKHLEECSHIIVTLGTSIVYFNKDNNNCVGNCHKIPASSFFSRRISLEETVSSLSNLISSVRNVNRNVHFIFTVSPIRHWKDGAVENMRSKSTLIIGISEVCDMFENVSYFPSYEIMMDDLRDYRFYADDMLHPSEQAVDYIWNAFSETYIDNSCCEKMKLIDKLNKAKAHRFERGASMQEMEKFNKYIASLEEKIQ